MDKSSVQYNGFRGGAIVFIGLIAYFFIMKMLGLEHNLELRAFNLVIMAFGVYYAINQVFKHNAAITYLKGIGSGIVAAASSAIAFAIVILIYLLANPEFMSEIEAQEPFGLYLNPFIISAIIFLEGTGSGVLLSYGLMQWYRGRIPESS